MTSAVGQRRCDFVACIKSGSTGVAPDFVHDVAAGFAYEFMIIHATNGFWRDARNDPPEAGATINFENTH